MHPPSILVVGRKTKKEKKKQKRTNTCCLPPPPPPLLTSLFHLIPPFSLSLLCFILPLSIAFSFIRRRFFLLPCSKSFGGNDKIWSELSQQESRKRKAREAQGAREKDTKAGGREGGRVLDPHSSLLARLSKSLLLSRSGREAKNVFLFDIHLSSSSISTKAKNRATSFPPPVDD